MTRGRNYLAKRESRKKARREHGRMGTPSLTNVKRRNNSGIVGRRHNPELSCSTGCRTAKPKGEKGQTGSLFPPLFFPPYRAPRSAVRLVAESATGKVPTRRIPYRVLSPCR